MKADIGVGVGVTIGVCVGMSANRCGMLVYSLTYGGTHTHTPRCEPHTPIWHKHFFGWHKSCNEYLAKILVFFAKNMV